MRKTTALILTAIAYLAMPLAAAAQDQAPPPPADPADDCQMVFDTSADAEAQLQANGLSFPGFAALCPVLRDAGLGVAADGASGVVSDRSYGLMEVKLYDLATRTRGWQSVTSTSLAEDTAPGASPPLLLHAINNGLRTIAEQPEPVIASVAEELARLRLIAASAPPLPEAPAAECQVRYLATNEFLALVNAWSDLPPASDALCQRMAAAGAGIILTDASGAILERTYGWIKIGLFDTTSGLGSAYRSTTISLVGNDEEDAGHAALHDALAIALEHLERDQDQFFASLATEVAEMRRILAPPSN